MNKVPFWAFVAFLSAASHSTLIFAAPQVLPTAASSVSVGISDTIRFNNGSTTGRGSQITLIAPDGQGLVFLRSNTSNNGDFDQVVFSLNGTGIERHSDWTATGNLIGAPVDGTWQVLGGGIVAHTGLGNISSIEVSVGEHLLDIAVVATAPETLYTLWNWHEGTSSDYNTFTLGATRPISFYSDNRHSFEYAIFFNDTTDNPDEILADTDGDGFPDFVEKAAGSDPNNPNSTPLTVLANVIIAPDDPDGEGIPPPALSCTPD